MLEVRFALSEFISFCFRRVTCFAALLFSAMLAFPASAESPWQGNWESNYGQLRLLQDGARVWGDYADRGTLEGVTSPDGDTVRGVFVYTTDKWGTFEFHKTGDTFEGTWRWTAPTEPGDKSWTGRQVTRIPSDLRYASPTGPRRWPQNVDPAGALLNAFLSFNESFANFADGKTPNGPWHGGYSLNFGTPDIEMMISLDQVGDGASGFADIYMAVLSSDFACPPAMHPNFCQELKSLAAGVTIKATDLGVHYQNETTAHLAIGLGSDPSPRLLEVSHEPAGLKAKLYHPTRGLDVEAQVQREPHICEEMQCLADRLADLVAAPDTAGLGIFADDGFAKQFGKPVRTAQDTSLLHGVWQIFDETSEPLGRLSFASTEQGLSVRGALQVHPFSTPLAKQNFNVQKIGEDALSIGLQLLGDGSGEQVEGHILLDLPQDDGGISKGSLFVGDDVFVIDLVRQNGGTIAQDDTVLGDTPGFGIYRFVYELEGIPEGKSLALRAGPSRDAEAVGTLRADVRDILLLECTPEPDNIAFDTASIETQRVILSSRWCKAQSGGVVGFLPGVYLVPIPQ